MNPGTVTLGRMLLAGAWSGDRGRLSLTAIAIALAVALGVAVHLINFSAAAEFDAATRAMSGDADLIVSGPRTGFDERLYPDIARRPDVSVASPIVETDAKLADGKTGLRIVGIDPFRALQIQPGLLGDAGEHLLDLLRPRTAMLSQPAAAMLGVGHGDRLAVQSAGLAVELEIVGILPAGRIQQPLALMDIAAAQWVLGSLGRLTRIEIRLAAGTSRDAAVARFARDLPPGLLATTAAQASEQGLGMSRAYRVNLNMLALVSLFTGAVLVFSTQTLSMLRRRTQFALLRALGVPARQLWILLTAEAALVGIVGALGGAVLGTACARLALAYAGSDLGAGFFSGLSVGMRIDWSGIAAFALAGIAASALGGLLPALDAARASPARALRAGDEQDSLSGVPTDVPAWICLASGALLALMPPVGGLPVFGYAAVALILLGALLLMPSYVRIALRAMPAAPSWRGWLALEQLRGAPGYAAIGLAGILASFSLVVAMLVMIHSFRTSLDAWLGNVLPADLYVRATSGHLGWLDRTAQMRLAGLPGVHRIAFTRHDAVVLDPGRPPVALIARDLPDGHLDGLPLVESHAGTVEGTGATAWISEAVRDLHGLRAGDTFRLPIQDRFVTVRVAGIWRDYVRQGGAIVVPRQMYIDASGDDTANDASIWLQPGADPETVTRAVRAALGAGSEVEIREPGRIRALSLAAFDRTFAVTYAMQLAALVIGLFGISIGTSAQAIARRREFGVLRHLGLSVGDLARMVAFEGCLVGALGAMAGTITGAATSLVLIGVVNRQSFHWSMDLHLPWMQIGGLGLLLVICAGATAAVSARRALGADTIRAVKEDW